MSKAKISVSWSPLYCSFKFEVDDPMQQRRRHFIYVSKHVWVSKTNEAEVLIIL